MMTHDEFRQWCKDVLLPIAIAVIGIVVGALGMSVCGCDAFTPHQDTSGFPCHNPRMRSCGNGACCWNWQACMPNGECETAGPAASRDAGAD